MTSPSRRPRVKYVCACVCFVGNIYQLDRIPSLCVVYSALIMRPLTHAFVYHVSLLCLRRVARRDGSNSSRVQQRSLGRVEFLRRDLCLHYLRDQHTHTHTHTWNTHGMRVESVGGKRDPQRDSLALLPLAREGSLG